MLHANSVDTQGMVASIRAVVAVCALMVAGWLVPQRPDVAPTRTLKTGVCALGTSC